VWLQVYVTVDSTSNLSVFSWNEHENGMQKVRDAVIEEKSTK
jgi:hypothetical protein